jgi:hypothetical protein
MSNDKRQLDPLQVPWVLGDSRNSLEYYSGSKCNLLILEVDACVLGPENNLDVRKVRLQFNDYLRFELTKAWDENESFDFSDFICNFRCDSTFTDDMWIELTTEWRRLNAAPNPFAYRVREARECYATAGSSLYSQEYLLVSEDWWATVICRNMNWDFIA